MFMTRIIYLSAETLDYSCEKHWKDITMYELKTFIGILIVLTSILLYYLYIVIYIIYCFETDFY